MGLSRRPPAGRLLAAALVAAGLLAGCAVVDPPQAQPTWVPKPEGPAPGELPNERVPLGPDGGSAPGSPSSPIQPGSPDDPDVVAAGLTLPWGLAVLPDGSALVGERTTGRVLRVQPRRAPAMQLMQITGLDTSGDGGLLDLTLSPDYVADNLIFAYITTPTDNRVIRFEIGGRPTPVLTGIPRGKADNGGRLAFGPDGMLYIGTGDAGQPGLAADPRSLAGKVLRVTLFGQPAPGNPDPRSPVFTRGHRNVAGLCVTATGTVEEAESWPSADPISRLVGAAERVSGGDLSARVPEGDKDDELVSLSRAFNRMTYQIQSQQSELIDANRQLDERRRFTETVLTGVSAGVIGLDRSGRIYLPNRTASALLGVDLDLSIGEDLAEVAPEMARLLKLSVRRPDRLAQAQVQIAGADSMRTLLVRIAAEHDDGEIRGFVVTFDDITELVSAQRKAAWADIARRIAHEIKNPLTPIQLAAERLRRKYLKEIKKDPETFRICTDTIIRHVEDIGRMVDEFSSFARMPTPVLKPEDLATIVEQAVFLERTAHPKIGFETRFAARPVPLRCDARLIGQALINIIKNAIESIEGRIAESGASPPGQIVVTVEADGPVAVTIEDNGKGLPRQGREQLTEPYVTTRAKGTGLGLAIVKKIMEDHRGQLMLSDRERGGARVRLIFAGDAHPASHTEPLAVPAELSSVSHGA